MPSMHCSTRARRRVFSLSPGPSLSQAHCKMAEASRAFPQRRTNPGSACAMRVLVHPSKGDTHTHTGQGPFGHTSPSQRSMHTHLLHPHPHARSHGAALLFGHFPTPEEAAGNEAARPFLLGADARAAEGTARLGGGRSRTHVRTAAHRPQPPAHPARVRGGPT